MKKVFAASGVRPVPVISVTAKELLVAENTRRRTLMKSPLARLPRRISRGVTGIDILRRLSVRTVSLLAMLGSLISASPAGSTCTATLSLQKTGNGGITYSIFGAGACPSDKLGPVEMYLSYDGGPFILNGRCLSSPCSQGPYTGFYPCLKGIHSVELEVTCWKPGPNSTNGSCDIQDEPGHSKQNFDMDHTPSITGVDAHEGAGAGPSGVLRYRAPDAWTDHVVVTEWIGGSSSGSSVAQPVAASGKRESHGAIRSESFGSVRALDDSDGNYQTGFSPPGAAPPGSKMLLVTVVACGDKKDSIVLSAVDNDCATGGGSPSSPSGSCPAACAGKPIRLSNGNMRMTDRDPLPGSDAFALIRTYDNHGAVPGFFGFGWTSPFDSRLLHFQSLGRAFLEIQTASNSEYVFQNVGDSWIQMWPRGATPATLIPGDGTYTLREPRSVVETVFDSVSGRPMREHSRASGGRDTILSYLNGVPSHVADSWGNWAWTLNADTTNRITSIAIDGTSLAWTYNYDANGNLTSVLGPSNAAWRSYVYDQRQCCGRALTEARDARGNLIESHNYAPGSDRALSSISDQDDITSIAYDLPGRDSYETITRTTSATGATTDYYIRYLAGRPRTVQIVGHCASCGTNDAVYAYEALTGRLLREQDARGYITVRNFDQNDRVISLGGPYRPADCDPATDVAHCRQTPPSLLSVALLPTAATLSTSYVYGDVNWPDVATLTSSTSVLAPNHLRTTAVDLDPATGTITLQVTTGMTGNPPQSTQYTTTTALYDGTEGAAFNPGGAFDAAWLSLPQPSGLRKINDGPRTDVADTTAWVYYPIDAAVPGPWRGRLSAVRNAAGNVTRFDNYAVFGNAGRMVDANGVATEYTFDAMGRVLTSTLKGVAGCDTTADPLCATDIVSSRTYQPALGPLASTTMPGGGTTTYEYDSRGRTSATARQVSATAYERIEYGYDPATGRKSAERYLGGHPGSWSTTHSDAFLYDTFARLSEIDHSDGTRVVYHYDGANNLVSVQDERHSTANTTYAYDPTNRLASVTQTLSPAPGGQIATAYAYDIHGNLASVTDPNGNVTSYAYDDFGRMISQTSPVTGVTTYVYDPASNLISTTDANSATTTRAYDALNRVTSAASSGVSTESVSWSYDGEGPFSQGRLATMTDPTGSTSYRYERRGALLLEQKTIGSATYSTGFQYDTDGNRASMTYPSGRTVTYTFDFADRPYSASSAGNSVVSSVTYLPFGPMLQQLFGNGTTKTMQYDSRYRPLENKLTGPLGPIADYTYQEDGAGNILQIHDAIDPTYNRDFGYDDLNRLTTANSGSALWGAGSYSYDAMGNLLASSLGSRATAFAYSGTTPKLANVVENGTAKNVTYDAAGNELAIGASSFDYSARNQLVAGDHSTYAYDGRGIRTITLVPAGLAMLTVTPTSAPGGTTLAGMVTLDGPAPAGGQSIALSSNSAAATVPATIIVPEGAASATFDITTSPVGTTTTVTISASDGSRVRTAACTLQPPAVTGLAIVPAEVTGGQTATATITINGPAPDAGLSVSVTITGSNTVAPSTITIAAGNTSGTFTITTTPVPATVTSTISVSANGGTASAALQIDPPVPAVLTIQPPSVTAGMSTTGTVTLSGSAPAGGTLVTLSSDNVAVSLPANVTILAGATSATFTITTSSTITAMVTATVRASAGTTSVSAILTIAPPPVVLASLVLSPASVVGGLQVSATVTLTNPASEGGALVTITSDDLSIAAVPDSVLVPQGATAATLTIDTTTILTQTVVGITASFNGVSQTIPLTVQPPPSLALLSLTIAPVNVAGGSGATGTVTLTGSAPSGGADVLLVSDNASIVSIPSHVTVRKGDTAATFAIATFAVTATQSVRVSGSYGGLTQRDTLTVIPATAIQLTNLTITPTSIPGGATATGTVTMSALAPTGGLVVSLASRHKNFASVPSSVTVPGGASSASFVISAQSVKSTHTVDITATYASVTKIATLTVTKSVAMFTIFGRLASAFRHVPVSLSVTSRVIEPQTSSLPGRYSLYTPELNLMAETTTAAQSPTIAYEYIWFGGQPVAQIETATNRIHYYFNDHLGTPILTTDVTAAVDWRVEREPFGLRNAVRTGASRHQPLAFPGQEEDASTDRSYNIFRWYRSSFARYTQADPMGLSAGPNVYAYALDDPISLFDRLGLVAEILCKNVGTGGHKIPGAYHCRVRVSCDKCNKGGVPESDSTYGMEYTGNPPYTINEWPYPNGIGPDYTISRPITHSGMSDCQFAKCVQANNNVFKRGYTGKATGKVPTYSISGPNSNTYAHRLVATCGGMTDFPFGAAGSNDDPWPPFN